MKSGAVLLACAALLAAFPPAGWGTTPDDASPALPATAERWSVYFDSASLLLAEIPDFPPLLEEFGKTWPRHRQAWPKWRAENEADPSAASLNELFLKLDESWQRTKSLLSPEEHRALRERWGSLQLADMGIAWDPRRRWQSEDKSMVRIGAFVYASGKREIVPLPDLRAAFNALLPLLAASRDTGPKAPGAAAKAPAFPDVRAALARGDPGRALDVLFEARRVPEMEKLYREDPRALADLIAKAGRAYRERPPSQGNAGAGDPADRFLQSRPNLPAGLRDLVKEAWTTPLSGPTVTITGVAAPQNPGAPRQPGQTGQDRSKAPAAPQPWEGTLSARATLAGARAAGRISEEISGKTVALAAQAAWTEALGADLPSAVEPAKAYGVQERILAAGRVGVTARLLAELQAAGLASAGPLLDELEGILKIADPAERAELLLSWQKKAEGAIARSAAIRQALGAIAGIGGEKALAKLPSLADYLESLQPAVEWRWANLLAGSVPEGAEFTAMGLGRWDLGPETRLRKASVEGRPGLWISREEDQLVFTSFDGRLSVRAEGDGRGGLRKERVLKSESQGSPARVSIETRNQEGWLTYEGRLLGGRVEVDKILDHRSGAVTLPGIKLTLAGEDEIRDLARRAAALLKDSALAQARVEPLARWLLDVDRQHHDCVMSLTVASDGTVAAILNCPGSGDQNLQYARFVEGLAWPGMWDGHPIGEALVVRGGELGTDGAEDDPRMWRVYVRGDKRYEQTIRYGEETVKVMGASFVGPNDPYPKPYVKSEKKVYKAYIEMAGQSWNEGDGAWEEDSYANELLRDEVLPDNPSLAEQAVDAAIADLGRGKQLLTDEVPGAGEVFEKLGWAGGKARAGAELLLLTPSAIASQIEDDEWYSPRTAASLDWRATGVQLETGFSQEAIGPDGQIPREAIDAALATVRVMRPAEVQLINRQIREARREELGSDLTSEEVGADEWKRYQERQRKRREEIARQEITDQDRAAFLLTKKGPGTYARRLADAANKSEGAASAALFLAATGAELGEQYLSGIPYTSSLKWLSRLRQAKLASRPLKLLQAGTVPVGHYLNVIDKVEVAEAYVGVVGGALKTSRTGDVYHLAVAAATLANEKREEALSRVRRALVTSPPPSPVRTNRYLSSLLPSVRRPAPASPSREPGESVAQANTRAMGRLWGQVELEQTQQVGGFYSTSLYIDRESGEIAALGNSGNLRSSAGTLADFRKYQADPRLSRADLLVEGGKASLVSVEPGASPAALAELDRLFPSDPAAATLPGARAAGPGAASPRPASFETDWDDLVRQAEAMGERLDAEAKKFRDDRAGPPLTLLFEDVKDLHTLLLDYVSNPLVDEAGVRLRLKLMQEDLNKIEAQVMDKGERGEEIRPQDNAAFAAAQEMAGLVDRALKGPNPGVIAALALRLYGADPEGVVGVFKTHPTAVQSLSDCVIQSLYWSPQLEFVRQTMSYPAFLELAEALNRELGQDAGGPRRSISSSGTPYDVTAKLLRSLGLDFEPPAAPASEDVLVNLLREHGTVLGEESGPNFAHIVVVNGAVRVEGGWRFVVTDSGRDRPLIYTYEQLRAMKLRTALITGPAFVPFPFQSLVTQRRAGKALALLKRYGIPRFPSLPSPTPSQGPPAGPVAP